MVRSKWKNIFIDYKLLHQIKKNKKVIYTNSRQSIILPNFVGRTFFVHNGNKYLKLLITKEMVGRKFGEFIFTRRIGRIHIQKNTSKRK